MELNRLQKLAGLPLTESVNLTEGAITKKVELTWSPKAPGQLGDMAILDYTPEVEKLAKLIGIEENELPKKFGSIYVQFTMAGLIFMERKQDGDTMEERG